MLIRLVPLLALVASTIVGATDPAFTYTTAILDATLTCYGTSLSASALKGKDILLMVPGTGSNAQLSYEHGYQILAPGLGLLPCSVSPTPMMLDNIVKNSEIVVRAINRLYGYSGNKIRVITWSQGGLATQWGLTFFPSIRAQISSFMALAPDFRGSTLVGGVNAITPLKAVTGDGNLASTLVMEPAVSQQMAGSNFLLALSAAGGLVQFVPTTTLASETDEIVQPPYSSNLEGAVNVIYQTACGANTVLLHENQLEDGFAYSLAKQAFSSSSGQADASSPGNTTLCFEGKTAVRASAPGLTNADRLNLDSAIVTAALSIAVYAGELGDVVGTEPTLPAYATTASKRRALGRITRMD